MKYYIGIDLGGTNIVAGVVDENYNIISKASTKTNLPRPEKEIADDMGISRGSVTRAVNQALERIRRKFDFEAHYELAAGGLA